MEIKRVKDVMIPLDQYPHINHSLPVRDAMAKLERAQFDVGERKSLPRVMLVFSDANELIGAASRRDIFRGLDPESLSEIMLPELLGKVKQGEQAPSDKVIKKLVEKVQRPISEVMTPVKDSVDYQDSIVNAIYKMADHNLSFLPVMKEKEVVGVVRTVELLREVAMLCNINKPR
ncbi:HPP family protein [Elusimicrobiota bacterium]